MKKQTSWKTTVAGLVGLVSLMVGLFFVYAKICTFTELGVFMGILGTFVLSIGQLFAKDGDVTGGTRDNQQTPQP